MERVNSDINAINTKELLNYNLKKNELQKELNFCQSACPPDYRLLTYIELETSSMSRRERVRTLTAVEASELILKSSPSEIPVIIFMQRCFLVLKRIPFSEESTLLNILIAELRDNAGLQIPVNKLKEMKDLVTFFKKTYFLHIDPIRCMDQINKILIQENESIFDYIARFLLLHIIILEFEVRCNRTGFTVKSIISRIERRHKVFLLMGLHPRCNDPWPLQNIIYVTFEEYLKEIAIKFEENRLGEMILARTRSPIQNVCNREVCFFCGEFGHPNVPYKDILKANASDEGESFTASSGFRADNCIREERQEIIRFNLSKDNPTLHMISSVKIDEHIQKIGMLTAEEASDVIPYFNGFEPPVYDFIKTCYIALSNILIDEHEDLVRITMSRLKGEAAECVKWILITNMIDLIELLILEFDNDRVQYCLNEMDDIYLLPTESFYEYIVRFKRLHGPILHDAIMFHCITPIKLVISFTETNHMVEFMKGFYTTSCILDRYCCGFQEFLEILLNKYESLETNTTDEDEKVRNVFSFDHPYTRASLQDNTIKFNSLKIKFRIENGSYNLYTVEPYLTQLRNILMLGIDVN